MMSAHYWHNYLNLQYSVISISCLHDLLKHVYKTAFVYLGLSKHWKPFHSQPVAVQSVSIKSHFQVTLSSNKSFQTCANIHSTNSKPHLNLVCKIMLQVCDVYTIIQTKINSRRPGINGVFPQNVYIFLSPVVS